MTEEACRRLQCLLESHPTPTEPSAIGAYLEESLQGFKYSESYRSVLGSGDEELLVLSTVACSALGHYVLELLAAVETAQTCKSEIECRLEVASLVMEALARSPSVEVVNSLFVGTFEAINGAAEGRQYQAAYDLLLEQSRIEWDTWMPLNSTRPYKPKNRK